MRSNKSRSAAKSVFAILLMFLLAMALAALPAQAQKFKVLHTFHGKDGAGPGSTLVRDAAGNLYGTTGSGGRGRGVCVSFFVDGCGTAFKLDKTGVKIWQHSFQLPTGIGPEAGLLRDKAGNLYGTTYQGGDTECPVDQYGCGTVFKLSENGKETVLHKFTGTPDGFFPDAPLVEDAAGNLYGTTQYGGSNNAYGAVFKVDKKGKESVLYSFTGGSDGCHPSGVILDSAGNLYGVTPDGGSESCGSGGDGVAFKLGPTGDFTVLHTFGGSDGANPLSMLLLDASGNLYGTTVYGGNSECGGSGCGVVLKLSPAGTETVLYTFCSLSNCADGANPIYGPLVRDSEGNLYDSTLNGGAYSDCNGGTCGVVFRLDTAGKETMLHNFTGRADGAVPLAGLVMDKTGELYGTASAGGDLKCEPSYGCGVVFEVTP